VSEESRPAQLQAAYFRVTQVTFGAEKLLRMGPILIYNLQKHELANYKVLVVYYIAIDKWNFNLKGLYKDDINFFKIANL
jgi:hypothetical protein